MAKLRDLSWPELPRQSRLARVMYGNLAEPEYHEPLRRMAAAEGKKPPVGVPDAPAPTRNSKIVWAAPKPSKYR
jgi:hypothetical protein